MAAEENGCWLRSLGSEFPAKFQGASMTSTEAILKIFEQISAIPHESKNEAALRQWLIEWAASNGLTSKKDIAGNLAIYVPASNDRPTSPTVILQGHLDMVCQKTPDSSHDFTRDPIRFIQDGDWLKADKTTLGADNGIAIAIAMALTEDEAISHPPLELLFTVEEESGLIGAETLDPNLLTGKTLINLDSEDDGVFTVGCSGGVSVYMNLPVQWDATEIDETFFEIKVGGLRGGHSGGDIHRHRGNANKILARALDEIQRAVPIRLAALKGGTARNAIPRDAEAVFVCPKGYSAQCSEIAVSFEKTLRTEFGTVEHGLFLTLTKSQIRPEKYIGLDDTKKCIQFVIAMPNGVREFSATIDGNIETSNNIGIINLQDDGFHVIASPRSSVASRLEELARHAEAIAMFAGATSKRSTMSLPWMPNLDSPILKKCVDTYESLYKQKPKIEVIHGGLECGIINERCGGMDAISLGPTIENPHSPDERLFIPSLSRTWDFLTSLLRTI